MRRRLPSLNALRAFEAAQRYESFTLAAAELTVTHAAISRHIRDLEQWLGVPLFVRTGRGVTLTEEGRDFGGRLTPLFDGIAAATERIAVRRDRRQLVISVEMSLAALWLVPRLGAFTDAHPDIDLVLDPSNRLVGFAREQVDAGIRYGRGSWPGTMAEKLVDSIVTPVCCPDLLAARPLRSPADLAGETLLQEEVKEYWQAWLTAAGVADRVPVRGPVLKGYLTISAAEAGQGFALAESILAADALREGRLVQPFPAIEVSYGAYYLVRAADRPPSSGVEALADWLRGEIACSLAGLPNGGAPS